MASFENGSLLPFQQHWKVQYVGKIYGNFRHKDSGGANAAQAKATRFMKPVDKLLAEYDSCKNAAARATWLEPHKMKTKGSIAALREGFLQHICNCKSPVLESTLGETLPAPGSLPVGEGPGGKGEKLRTSRKRSRSGSRCTKRGRAPFAEVRLTTQSPAKHSALQDELGHYGASTSGRRKMKELVLRSVRDL
eukprot:s140_g18.t1